MSVTRTVPRKLKTWTDVARGHFAILIEADAPTRVHAINGSYMFSVQCIDGRTVIFVDPTATDHPQAGISRTCTWANPLGE